MHLTPDQIVFWQHGVFKLNATIVFTWGLMFALAAGSKLITRNLSNGLERSRWQNLLEIIVSGIGKQIEEAGLRNPRKYIGFLGTLFLFIAAASFCTVIPGYEPPTASLSTTAALALSGVLVAVPLLRYRGPRCARLSEILCGTDSDHAAIQYHQRTFENVGPGGPPFRQHDERGDDYRHSADHHALHFSGGHDGAWSAHRHGAGLHIFSILATVYIAAATRTP